MKIKLLVLSVLFIFSFRAFAQNILVDPEQVSVFVNGGFAGNSVSSVIGIGGGITVGGIADFGFQYGFASIESLRYPYRNIDYNTTTFFINGVLTRKKMLVSLDFSLTGFSIKSQTLMGFALSFSKRYELSKEIETTLTFSPGIAFNINDLFEQHEFAVGFNAILLWLKHFYLGPSIGYSNKKFYYGFDIGGLIFLENIDNK